MDEGWVQILQAVLFFASWGLPIWMGNWWPRLFSDQLPKGEHYLALPEARRRDIDRERDGAWEAYHRSGQAIGFVLEIGVWVFIFWWMPRLLL